MVVRVATTLARFLYRASSGRIGGRFGKARVLLLTTTGRRTHKRRTTPVAYLEDSDRLVVIASFGGADVHPSWYLNLVANPKVEAQLRGRPPRPMRARVATGDERERLWPEVVAMWPGYQRYRDKTTREIPLVILEEE